MVWYLLFFTKGVGCGLIGHGDPIKKTDDYISSLFHWYTRKHISESVIGLTIYLTCFSVTEFKNDIRFALPDHVSELWIIPIFIIFWYFLDKNKVNNNFKYLLDVKDLLKASSHWKIMSLSKIYFQEALHR